MAAESGTLLGRKGHREDSAAGRDPLPFIVWMEKFANEGGMRAEQLWDAADLPGGRMKRGGPTGSAMPLCWSHAEYVSLVGSRKHGVCSDRIERVYQRYTKAGTGSKIEMWTLANQTQRTDRGKTLSIISKNAATIHWSFDGWATANDLDTRDTGSECWFGDLPSDQISTGARVVFTFMGQEELEGKDFQLIIQEVPENV